MNIWWESLTNLQQIFALVAIPATLLLLLQTLLLLFGMSQQGGTDGDSAGDAQDGGLDQDDFEFDQDDFDLDQDDFELDQSHNSGHDSSHGSGHSHAGGHHDSGLRIFTVRAFVAFFTIFGWMGLALTDGGMNSAPAVAISFAAGVAAMVGMAWFFKFTLNLQSTGNIDFRNSLGKTATVYIPIPARRAGKGKVTVTVQGRFSEVDAVTDSEVALKTGVEVVVVAMTNQNVLCVMPLHESTHKK